MAYPGWEIGLMGALSAVFAGSLYWAIQGEAQDRQAERRTALAWYAEHPPTPEQAAANEHFRLCRRYRFDPDPDRRKMMMAEEACYPRDRDDPRLDEATFPWNEGGERPWRKKPG